jgi:hypothetical protein
VKLDSTLGYDTSDTRKDIFSLDRWSLKTLSVSVTSLEIFHKE